MSAAAKLRPAARAKPLAPWSPTLARLTLRAQLWPIEQGRDRYKGVHGRTRHKLYSAVASALGDRRYGRPPTVSPVASLSAWRVFWAQLGVEPPELGGT